MTIHKNRIPNINNDKVLCGHQLARRWNMSWGEIKRRIVNDGLLCLENTEFQKEIDSGFILDIDLGFGPSPFESHINGLSKDKHVFILEEHIWPYEELHPELKAAAQDLYDKVFPSAPIWDSESDGRAVKGLHAKAPLDPENQKRALLAHFLKGEGFTHSEIASFLEPGQEKNPGTVNAWITSGELILNRLHENKKIK